MARYEQDQDGLIFENVSQERFLRQKMLGAAHKVVDRLNEQDETVKRQEEEIERLRQLLTRTRNLWEEAVAVEPVSGALKDPFGDLCAEIDAALKGESDGKV